MRNSALHYYYHRKFLEENLPVIRAFCLDQIQVSIQSRGLNVKDLISVNSISDPCGDGINA